MIKFLIILCFLSSFSNAATFVPVSIKTQIREADAVIYGKVQEQESILIKDNQIATKVILKLDKWIGINTQSNNFEVLIPGGHLNNKSTIVSGVPSFKIGEKIVLFLGQDSIGNFWVKNLALGKYNERMIGTAPILVNEMFPNNPNMGQISLKVFFEMSERLKGTKFKERLKDKYEVVKLNQKKKSRERAKRSLASESKILKEEVRHQLTAGWIIGIFISIYTLVTFFRKRIG